MAFPPHQGHWVAGWLFAGQRSGQGDPFLCGTQTGKRESLTKMRFQPQGTQWCTGCGPQAGLLPGPPC